MQVVVEEMPICLDLPVVPTRVAIGRGGPSIADGRMLRDLLDKG